MFEGGGHTVARLIFHIDVNSAFLSWEAARRVKNGEADLRLIPSAVCGERETRRGVILAKSIPAKKYGVKTGEPVAMALRKCPTLTLVPHDFELYQRSSRAFVAVLEKYAPVVEQYSIDECFLDMSDTETVYPDPVAIAYKIKDEIRDTLGFTVNVGIGRNKLCAKMAGDFEKPDRVHTLWPHEIAEKMWPLPVRDLLGVGAATAEKLERHALYTIGDVARCDVGTLVSFLGKKGGEHIHQCANGIDNSVVRDAPEEAKGYSNSTTLATDITGYGNASPVMLALADSVATRMRRDGVKAYCISVTVRTTDFVDRSHQKKLSVSTDVTGEIHRISMVLLRELWNERVPIRLLGLALSDIDRGDAEQLTLFPDEAHEARIARDKRLDLAMDEVRNKFGSGMIKRASVGLEVGKKHSAAADVDSDI